MNHDKILWFSCVFAVACPAKTSLASEEPSALSGSTECRYAIAYDAPASCGDTYALERRLGPNYRVVPGTMQSCAECVRGIGVEQTDDEQRFQMHLAGFESKAVERSSCEELLELAIYSIEASDLPVPVCERPLLQLGAAVRSWRNVSQPDWVLAGELRLVWNVGRWSVEPFGFWMVPTQVQNLQRNVRSDLLDLSGYGAGGSLCRSAFGSIDICGIGMWRSYEIDVPGPNLPSRRAAWLWSVGAELGWDWPLFDGVIIELAPSILFGLGNPKTRDRETQSILYEHGGTEVHLKVGLAWESGARNRPRNVGTLRTADVGALDAKWF